MGSLGVSEEIMLNYNGLDATALGVVLNGRCYVEMEMTLLTSNNTVFVKQLSIHLLEE